MKLNRPKPRGFTLVELLVVIVIIGILAALITVAVSAALVRAREARITLELGNLAGAIQQYKAKYGSYPPSTHNLVMQPPRTMLLRHIRQLWPRVTDADLATLPPVMNAAEILTFCVRGYTSDPQRPVNYLNNTVKRDSFFDFDTGRLRPGRAYTVNIGGQQVPGQTTVYIQPEKDAPYLYFDCSRPPQDYQLPNGGDNRLFPPLWESTVPQAQRYSGPTGTGMAKPYVTRPQSAGGLALPANSGTFQIIAAGMDGDFGEYQNPATVKQYPDGLNYAEGDKDNLVNFSERNLENSKP